ncbi:MAG: SprT-like domain-containing protein [Flavobacteriaceae bacterium]|jgi:SprT protein|nr:sprT domain-containing protein [Flavobacteriaceae bacterium]MCP4802403.1 sprT domain-containing protein [Bacteroidota bacterium]MDB2612390.1 SprT-like domain-containing protein [Flavobacteriaceae bacterium]MDC0957087.1 SprT-like domain-containing protein [Flavobacteriaceae bacterium]MDG1378944.1 SprT-like domain-containing protein [Flavobacteriaceae bacterium]|tara:strand:- start:1033 stop:1641 length:609 start_codon:yes stop_codon:yes gene_type:complete
MQELLKHYIPQKAIPLVLELLVNDNLEIKVKNERKTRHGDYRRLKNGKHQITVNSNLNHYRFLMTLIHEVAHFETYKTYGHYIKPHGVEWKRTFQHLMLPFLNPQIFPNHLLSILAKHFKNPKASSDTDLTLSLALKQFDEPSDQYFVFQVPEGGIFRLYNGRIFRKGIKRRKRFECIEVKSGKLYLFNANAEVELLNSTNE